MIKFSWKKINDKLDWNAHSVLEYFFLKQEIFPPCYLTRKIPRNVKMAASQPYPSGTCFIKNINEVLKGAKTPHELYMYLELASKRSVFDYRIRSILYLPIPLVEEYQLQWVELNPLLKIENNKVYFKYEEQEKQ
jgi:hypothetical protein